MPEKLPRVTQREMQFNGGTAIGMSQRWVGGQCCAIQTAPARLDRFEPMLLSR